MKPGTAVVDARLKRVGQVAQVVGRGDRPYALVRLEAGRKSQQMVGTILYLEGAGARPQQTERRYESRPPARRPFPGARREGAGGSGGGGSGGGSGRAGGGVGGGRPRHQYRNPRRGS
ncbi:MAG TPA: hypothetical protein VI893_06335 [Thermoplasmata archaeon]|nr:hypothetical protein [Thermoplasmata archaeon]